MILGGQAEDTSRQTRLTVALPAVLAALVLVPAIVDLELTTRAWDAHAQLASARRIVDLGGPFYVAGTDQKGPLWLGAYTLAYRLGGVRDVWWVVAAMAAIVGTATGAAIARIARTAGAPLAIAAGVGGATAVHLLFGREEYSQVLYSRNLVSLLSAIGFALIVGPWPRASRPAAVRAGLVGACFGLAVQTNPSSLVTAAVAGVALALAQGWRPRRGAWGFTPAMTAFAVAASLTVLSAPVWYLARGVFGDFWAQWWTYNTFYSAATGRPLVVQLGKGVRDFAFYYADHPVLLGILLLAVLQLVWRLRNRRPVFVDVMLLAWWTAECVAVALSQRFFPHYLVLPAVPVAAMAANGLGRLRWTDRPRPVIPIAATLLVIGTLLLSGADRFERGLRSTIGFRGFEAVADQHERALPPDRQILRAEVLRRSLPDDEIYVWTRMPWLYTDLERRSATRYIENRWLRGEIYWSGASPRWILPGTWTRWLDDIRRSDPRLVVEFSDDPIPPDTPAGELVRREYVVVFDDGRQRVYAKR